MKKEFVTNDMKIIIDFDKCTGSGECAIACPVDIFEVKDGKALVDNIEECVECCACVNACPKEAIEHSSC